MLGKARVEVGLGPLLTDLEGHMRSVEREVAEPGLFLGADPLQRLADENIGHVALVGFPFSILLQVGVEHGVSPKIGCLACGSAADEQGVLESAVDRVEGAGIAEVPFAENRRAVAGLCKRLGHRRDSRAQDISALDGVGDA